MAVDYKQYNYPYILYCGDSFTRTGCGPCSVADLLSTINAGCTPEVIAAWMTNNGCATPDGTTWDGINRCLTYYGGGGEMIACGMDGVMQCSEFEAWKSVIRSGRMGILDMHKVISNYWTNGGHYIAIVAYDKNTDRFLVYDPASVARTGWHGFGDFAGNICNLYTSTIRWNNDKEKSYRFEPKQVEYGFHGVDATILEMILYSRGFYKREWGMFDNSCGEKLADAIGAYQQERNTQGMKLKVDKKCGPSTWGDLFGTGKGFIDLVPIVGGSHGISVLFAQEMMSAYGYYLGALDRSFGDQSIAATAVLQGKLGLPKSGVWGYDMYKRVCTKPQI